MKVIVATKETQGQKGNDFFWGKEGELAYPSWVCDRDRRDPDGGCGCGRGAGGLESHKSGTSFKVVEVDYDTDELLRRATVSMIEAGWGEDMGPAVVEMILDIAEGHPEGTILGRRIDEFFVRKAA